MEKRNQACARTAIAVAVLLLAACGSTVSAPGAGGGQGDTLGAAELGTGSEEELGVPTGARPGGGTPPEAGEAGRANPRAAAAAAPPAAGVRQPAGAARPAPRAGQSRRLARGETATHIYFGAAYASSAGQTNDALGLENSDPGDARRYYDAVVADVNSHGGVLGKKLAPVYFDTAGQGSTDADQVAQAACTYYTQDRQVAVVVGRGHPVVRACTKQARILSLATGFSNATSRTFAEFGNYVEISTISLDRMGAVTVDGLARSRYLGAAEKIGLITWDDPAYRYGVSAGWEPALQRHGKRLTERAYVAVPQSPDDVSTSSAAVSNAVLRFRQAGITHVFIADGPAGMFDGTGLTLLFVRTASSQSYYPMYGLNQANSPQAGIDTGLWGSREMKGAHAITWGDLDEPTDKGTRTNAARLRCLEVMRKRGVTIDNVNARGAALAACDQVYFLRTALMTGGGADLDSALAGVHRIGSSYNSPLTYRTRFAHDRRDGVAAARPSVFDDACTCFRYTAAPYPLP